MTTDKRLDPHLTAQDDGNLSQSLKNENLAAIVLNQQLDINRDSANKFVRIDEKISHQDEKISHQDQNFGRMDERLKSMEKNLETLRADFNKANETLRADFNKANETLRADFNKANETNRSDFKEAIAALQKQINTNTQKIDVLEKQVSKVKDLVVGGTAVLLVFWSIFQVLAPILVSYWSKH